MLITQEKQFDGGHLNVVSGVLPGFTKYTKLQAAEPSIRLPSKRRSESNTYATDSNNLVRIDYDRTNFHDFRAANLEFDVTIDSPGSTYKRISQGIWSIFNRVKILTGEREQENLLEYNRLYAFIFETFNNPDTAATVGRGMMGIGTQIERNALGAVTTKYKMPIRSGFLTIGVLPLLLMRDILRLEFYLGDPLTYVETDGASPVVTLSNVRLNSEKLTFTPTIMRKFKAAISKGIDISFNTFTHYRNNAAGASEQDVKVPHVGDSVDRIWSFFTNSTNTNDMTANDKMLIWPKAGFQRVHYEINGNLYPEEPIEGADNNANQMYMEYLKTHGYYHTHGLSQSEPSIDTTSFNSDKFFMVMDHRSHRNEGLINPAGLSPDASDFLAKITFSAPFSNHYMHSFVEHEKFGILQTVHTITSRSIPRTNKRF